MKDTRHKEQEDVSGYAWVKMNVEGTANTITKQRALLTKQYVEHPSLDVACNTGGYTIFCGCTVAIDFVKKHLQTLRETTRNVMCVCATAEFLPFKTNIFKTVIATEIIEHAENPVSIIKEFVRIGKKLILTTPLTPVDSAGHRRLYTKKGILRLLKKFYKPTIVKELEEEGTQLIFVVGTNV